MNWANKQVQTWQMPQRIAMIMIEDSDNLIVALQDGLARFNLITASIKWWMDVEKEIINNRPNDGKCDSEGRLWLGTMDVAAKQGAGSLYCINRNKIVQQLSNLSIFNGMAWSLDNKHFYFIYSELKRIDTYLFDAVAGGIQFEKTAVVVPEQVGLPDGMCLDVEGMLWVAHWDGFCVARWNPQNGALLATVNLPAPQVTSCAFGGSKVNQLIITTASIGLSEEALLKYPESGFVFIAEPGVKGMPAFYCKKIV